MSRDELYRLLLLATNPNFADFGAMFPNQPMPSKLSNTESPTAYFDRMTEMVRMRALERLADALAPLLAPPPQPPGQGQGR